MKCLNCTEGRILPAIPHKGLENGIVCSICNGTGELPADIVYDPERGRDMKFGRIHGYHETLRDFCRKRGIDPVERSRQERGYFRREEG